MKTLTDLINSWWSELEFWDYEDGYKDAISGILKDIQTAWVTSVESIEKYLENLLK